MKLTHDTLMEMIEVSVQRIKEQMELQYQDLLSRVDEIEGRLDCCDGHRRDVITRMKSLNDKSEKLEQFVKTLADTPGGLVLDMFVVEDCSVKISEDIVGERELGVFRLFGYGSLDEFVCEALRLHLQRSRRL